MSNHIDISKNNREVPYYAIHKDEIIAGFFGVFSFLSNFYILENGIYLEELYYPSVEHAYQAAKWPTNQRAQFLDVTSAKAKHLGKLAPQFKQKKWDKDKVSIMSALCRQKFEANPKLKKMLLMTEDCLLEERNDWGDEFWGTNVDGVGENQLGKILTNIRHDLSTQKEMF